MEVSSADKYESAFKEAIKAGSAGLAVTQQHVGRFESETNHRPSGKKSVAGDIPRGDFVDSGGLMSYGPDLIEPYKRAASMVDKILKGAKPADLPVEQPTKFELMINLENRQGSWPDDSTGGDDAGGESD